MSWISAFFNRAANYEEAFQAKDITSQAMKEAIREWFTLYYTAEATKKEDPCMQIPYTIVRKLAKATFAEYTTTASDSYAGDILRTLNDKKRKEAFQKLLMGGEALLKPVPTASGWKWVVIARDAMLIFGRGADGEIIDVGTTETTNQGRYKYTLLERRTAAGGLLTIRNILYQSDSENSVGVRVPLSTMPQYEVLPDEYTFPETVAGLGLVQMRVPITNNVDGGNDGVSVYSAAVQAIHRINENEALLNGEFERGKSRIMAPVDMMKKEDGKLKLADEVFTAISEANVGDFPVSIFSPELRDESYKRRRDGYMRAIESIIGLQRGILSDVQEQERTATEITSSKGDYSLTVQDLQDVWRAAVDDAVKLCGALGVLYQVPGAHEVPENGWTVDFGDGILYDPDKEGQERLRQVQAGLLQPERYLGWYYNLPAETAAQRARIRRDYMPEDAGGEE